MHLLPSAILLALCTSLAAQSHTCTVTLSGTSCGPTLAVTMVPLGLNGNNTLTLHASGLHPRSAGGMIWGMNPISAPIQPSSSCLLLCDYVWGHYFQTDTLGEYTFARSWPAWFHGYFYMQMGSVADGANGVEVLTTDCQLVRCIAP